MSFSRVQDDKHPEVAGSCPSVTSSPSLMISVFVGWTTGSGLLLIFRRLSCRPELYALITVKTGVGSTRTTTPSLLVFSRHPSFNSLNTLAPWTVYGTPSIHDADLRIRSGCLQCRRADAPFHADGGSEEAWRGRSLAQRVFAEVQDVRRGNGARSRVGHV